MRMILCSKCGGTILGDKLQDSFRDKCQICGKIRQCAKWDIHVEKPKIDEGTV